jgi:molecular chaperone GrpE
VGDSDSRNAPGNPKPDALHADVSDEVIQAALRSVEGEEAAEGDRPAVVILEAEAVPDAPASAPPSEPGDLQQELRETRAALEVSMERGRETLTRLKDSHERHLRAAADLENYKKRALREREEVERFGIQKLLKELLPVLDNLDRALEHADAANTLTEGIVATRRIFEETLARHGVKAFTAVGQPFDPGHHEAMQQVVTSEAAPGTVVAELVRGYTLHGRLVRPALVSVAVAPEAKPDQSVDGGAN